MSNTNASHHGQSSDGFEAYLETDMPAYAVVKIHNSDTTPAVTLFTPSGLNCAADYLREFRDEIESAIAALVDLGAVEE